MITKYKLITGYHEDFVGKVEQALEDGWEFYGNIAIDGRTPNWYCREMVKRKCVPLQPTLYGKPIKDEDYKKPTLGLVQ